MIHYTLFKFKENTLNEEIINTFAEKYEQLEKNQEGFINPQIYRNVISRERNMDLMISVEVRSFEDLTAYLDSAEHKELQEKYDDIIAQQISFDHA